jgi:hypothetical protein
VPLMVRHERARQGSRSRTCISLPRGSPQVKVVFAFGEINATIVDGDLAVRSREAARHRRLTRLTAL